MDDDDLYPARDDILPGLFWGIPISIAIWAFLIVLVLKKTGVL